MRRFLSLCAPLGIGLGPIVGTVSLPALAQSPADTPTAPADSPGARSGSNSADVQPSGPDQPTNPAPTTAPGSVPPPGAHPGSIQLRTTEPEPVPPETRRHGGRVHDGFFLRFGLGITSLGLDGTMALNGISQSFETSGAGVMVPLLIGGTPTPGFVIGGGILGYSFSSPTYRYRGISVETSDSSVSVAMMGLFTQIYPVPTAGFFVHGMLALGWDSTEVQIDDTTRQTETATGWALSAATGYDFWISRHWSLGPEVRLSYVRNTYSGTGSTETHKYVLPTLSFMATWH